MTLWPPRTRGTHEADVSTEQQATQTNPRISGADEHRRRPQGAEAAARQRAEAAHRHDPGEAVVLTQTATAPPGSQRFPRRYRLRKRPEFLALQREGRRRQTAHFVVITRRKPHPPSRLGVTTSKKVGCAPERNRVRRLVREFFRRYHMTMERPHDVLVIARQGAPELCYSDVDRELCQALQGRD